VSGSEPAPITHHRVGVIGAGTMGAGITLVAAQAGHEVGLFDSSDGALERAAREIERRLEREVARNRLTNAEAEAIDARIHPIGSLTDLAGAGLVIEAIVEDLDAKQDVFRALEDIVGPTTILATNTSSLSVTAIAGALQAPERIVGMHFFNPPVVMPLVEVVRGAATADAVVADVVALAAAWGKTPVVCASTPGFIVNRVARPFYGEALRLLGEGAADAPTIDATVREAGGFRMGPLELMDLIGIDVNLAVSKSVYEQTFHDPRFAPSVIQQSLVDSGRLGRKTGFGFYRYGDSGPAPPSHGTVVAPSNQEVPIVRVVGDLGHAIGLVDRLAAAGVTVERTSDPTAPGHLVIGGTAVVPTDGRTATALQAAGELPGLRVVVMDLARDWATAARVAAAPADQLNDAEDPELSLQDLAAVLAAASIEVTPVDDTPGLLLMRIMVQLASVAADAAATGVATPADIDLAMRTGTNYPEGPLEWAEGVGVGRVVSVLDHMREHYREERYRAAASLRRAALTNSDPREG
jgi:3-hydroxybutyryl-CoA dehydrogenase